MSTILNSPGKEMLGGVEMHGRGLGTPKKLVLTGENPSNGGKESKKSASLSFSPSEPCSTRLYSSSIIIDVIVPHDLVASEYTVRWSNFGSCNVFVDTPRFEKTLPNELLEVMVRLFDLRLVRDGFGKLLFAKTEPREDRETAELLRDFMDDGARRCDLGDRIGTSKSLSIFDRCRVPADFIVDPFRL